MDGTTLGRFVLLGKIGEGGMGVVYRARDTTLERDVAIKLLPDKRLNDAERRARFLREARAASSLNHPHIVTIHEVGEQDSRSFIVMEFIEGKPLHELIAGKGMRLTDALRIAIQVADALAAAHGARIVHRDLKPGNIMVDAAGRAKVLDFGLAKWIASAASAISADETTQTITVGEPQTEEGVVLGSVPYMSPEQAEGRPVDARSDIFSFGAVLYEMITGRRAFRGSSRISILAAIVEKEPLPISETGVIVPPELNRLISRCLRKDVSRRSQNIADVKLALEELLEQSEAAKPATSRLGAAAVHSARDWLRTATAAASTAIILSALWIYLHRDTAGRPLNTEITRLSPEDGFSYASPSISPDGKFVVYTSDRSGKQELWIQQVRFGNPIQLMRSSGRVDSPQFLPDGSGILYSSHPDDGPTTNFEIIPTLGGEPRVIKAGSLGSPVLSPDGRQIAYIERRETGNHLMVMSLGGGPVRELPDWKSIPFSLVWTSDNRRLLYLRSEGARTVQETWDWYSIPVNGGKALPTGAGQVLRAAGLKICLPMRMVGSRILFMASKTELHSNVWEIGMSSGSSRVTGPPRQLTFGTESLKVTSASSNGMAAGEVDAKFSSDINLASLDPKSGQPAAAARQLTQDGREKLLYTGGGAPDMVYFVFEGLHVLDPETGRQKRLTPVPDSSWWSSIVSADGRRIAYSVLDGASFSIRVGDAGDDPRDARILCNGCGLALQFSPDGRFVLYSPEARPIPNGQKKTIRLMDLASGRDRPWLEHPADSVQAPQFFGQQGAWLAVGVTAVGSTEPAARLFILPWRETPVPISEWIDGQVSGGMWSATINSNFIYFAQRAKLMAKGFDPGSRHVTEPFEVKSAPGSAPASRVLGAAGWQIRSSGLVFIRSTNRSSVWLMKLPD